MKERITMEAIAHAAGVSRSTVSRALINHPRISAATKARIKEIAEQLGYCRDSHLSELMGYLRNQKRVRERPVVAILLWQSFPYDHSDFISGATERSGLWMRLLECGYQPEIFNIATIGSAERVERILLSRGIRGVIVCPFEIPAPLPGKWDQFCLVAIGHSIYNPGFHRAVTNHYQSTLLCIERLRQLGYQKIGAIIDYLIDHRNRGYFHAAYLLSRDLMKGDELAPLLCINEGEKERFFEWMEAHRPEALICGGLQSFEIATWLKERGIRVPEDVALAEMHLGLLLGPDEERSGIFQNAFEVGRAAVDLLVTLLQTNQTGFSHIPRTVQVNGIWKDGITTRCPS